MTNTITKNKIFNPQGDDRVANRTIIKGNTTGLFQLNDVKYKWATSLYTTMMGNFWLPEKVIGLGEDSTQFNELSEAEKRAYKGILSFLIFLDSMQTVNLPNFSDYITAPEVNLILAIQTYQESLHSQSYATIMETVIEPKDRDEIYYFWRTDKNLLERNEFIGKIYQDFIDNPNDKTFFKGVVGNFLLESIYFYNGFAFFHTLADQGKMLASDKMISYIQRDEESHITIFANIIREIRREFPEMYDEEIIIDMMKTAVEQEIKWSKHILGKGIIGMGHQNIEDYTKWLANSRLSMLGIKPIYDNVVSNPFKHLERFEDPNINKGNFFESTITNYSQSSAVNGSREF